MPSSRHRHGEPFAWSQVPPAADETAAHTLAGAILATP
jgi:hypothetical protein